MKIKKLDTNDYISFATSSGETVTSVNYAVTDYLAAAKNSENEKLVNLVTAMENYGVYAKHYFAVLNDGSTAARPDITDFSLVDATALAGYDYQIGDNIEHFTYNYTTLILEEETSFRLYFTSDDTSKLTITNGSTSLPIKTGTGQHSGKYYVEITNIVAKRLDTKYELNISNGTNITTAVVSPLGYAYKVLNGSSSDNLKYMVSALYYYNQAARTYFTN